MGRFWNRPDTPVEGGGCGANRSVGGPTNLPWDASGGYSRPPLVSRVLLRVTCYDSGFPAGFPPLLRSL